MEYKGCEVSVEMGGSLGYYQGCVVAVDGARQTLTIAKVIHNGRPAALNEVIINAGDIKDLKIISHADPESTKPQPKHFNKVNPKPKQQPNYQQQQPNLQQPSQSNYQQQQSQTNYQQQQSQTNYHQQQQLQPNYQQAQPNYQQYKQMGQSPTPGSFQQDTPKDKQRRKQRTSVGETLAHGSYGNGRDSGNDWHRVNQYGNGQEYSSPRRNDRYNDRYNDRTPQGKRDRRRNRDETTFGTPVDDDMLTTEFDFEKNLALFDKQAVFEEIQSLKPDVVRQADRYTEKKYRCDENVLPSKTPAKQQITVPTSGAAEVIYANDCGILVPSVRSELRAELLSTANQHGLTHSRQLEIIGRAATEVILSLSGGSHRLGPSNSHQPPLVVVVCGSHVQGAAGVNAARQLESHGVQTIVVTPQLPTSPPPSLLLTHELQLYALTGGRTVPDVRGISSTVDLIVDARLDHGGRAGETGSGHAWLTAVSQWASTARAPILALDPPSDLAALSSTQPPLPARVVMCPSLPLAYTPARGKVYLINVPIPQQTFHAVGIKYVSPFGAKLVIPLHPYE